MTNYLCLIRLTKKENEIRFGPAIYGSNGLSVKLLPFDTDGVEEAYKLCRKKKTESGYIFRTEKRHENDNNFISHAFGMIENGSAKRIK